MAGGTYSEYVAIRNRDEDLIVTSDLKRRQREASEMSVTTSTSTSRLLLRCGLMLEYLTLSWNVVGAVVLLVSAAAPDRSRSRVLGWTR